MLLDAPDPAHLQAEKWQVSQYFLVCQVIQSLYHLCDFVELVPVCVHLSSTGEAKAGPSTPDVSQQGQAGEKDHLPLPADCALPSVATSNVS